MKQKELAEQMKMSPTAISKICTKERELFNAEIEALADRSTDKYDSES